MKKNKKIMFVLLGVLGVAAVAFAVLFGGNTDDGVTYSLAEEVDHLVDNFDEEISLEGAKMYSSNPYDYKESKYYKELVGLGLDAVPLLSEKMTNGETSGLNQYLIGLAVQDITETDIAEAVGESWATGEQMADVWKKFIQTTPEKIEGVLNGKEAVENKIEKLKCYGIFGTVAVRSVKEKAKNNLLPRKPEYSFSSEETAKLEEYATSKNINVEQVNNCFKEMYEKWE